MFCSNCGKELLDNAVVCPGCGCMVVGKESLFNQDQTNSNVAKKSSKGIKNIQGIMGIIGFALLTVAILFSVLAISETIVIVDTYWNTYDVYIGTAFVDIDYALASMIFSLVGLIAITIAFIMAIVKKDSQLLTYILIFILSISITISYILLYSL